MNRVLGLSLVIALVFGVAGCVNRDTSFDYTNDELGFAAAFPSKPSETRQETQDVGDGETYTVFHVYAEEGPEQSTVQVQYLEPLSDAHPNAHLGGSDEDVKFVLGEALAYFVRVVTEDADADPPPIRYGSTHGNPSATAIFGVEDAGQVMWFYFTAVWRVDGKLYECRGVRRTESDAIAAADSFEVYAPGD